ncbi:MAG: hypothetical protein JW774_09465 [Candidatus Aureabacteria bacterium]|nr:hypothetical protein [Candidatus Auribacterota bacterium]
MNTRHTIIIISVGIIIFCLGIGWGLVHTPDRVNIIGNSSSDLFPSPFNKQYKSFKKDPLLIYGKSHNLLSFSQNEMKVQGMPFAYYQMLCTYKTEDVLEWYQNTWQDHGLLVMSQVENNQGNVEAIDWKQKRFLNVFVRKNSPGQETEIFATAISFPDKIIKNRDPSLKNLCVEGRTIKNGAWKNISWIENMGIKNAFSLTVQREQKNGWKLAENKMEHPLSYAVFSKSEKEMNFYVFRELLKPVRTVIQKMEIRE